MKRANSNTSRREGLQHRLVAPRVQRPRLQGPRACRQLRRLPSSSRPVAVTCSRQMKSSKRPSMRSLMYVRFHGLCTAIVYCGCVLYTVSALLYRSRASAKSALQGGTHDATTFMLVQQ